jgi:thiol-disulfide isomerase/thioredoxin
MARSRPGIATLALSAAAVLGYLSYRALNPVAPSSPPPEPTLVTGETEDVEAPPAQQTVDRLPDFTLTNLAGEPQSILSWPGEPMLINFWATWCAPCLREIPLLKQLQAERPDLQLVGIAIDKADLVTKFAADMQFNYPILIGQNEAWSAAAAMGVQIYALPFTVFASADGRMLGVHTGELHAEQLDNFRSVADDLAAAKIEIDEARARIAGRM